jgi:2-oxoisovalerate dehydrogenase E1 component
MQRDPEVFVIGEEVGHLRGGAYGTTRHVCRTFPERVFSSPISENGFSGLALGAAIMGMRPVVEFMFPDFALEAADQLFNHIPKIRHMFGGDVDVPLVVRTRTAQGRGFGPQHSCDPAALFALFPGWRIVAPSTPADYVGLFNSAIEGNDPVLIIEHHRLWTLEGPIPDLDARIPFGKGRIARPGRDLTVLTWSHPVHRVVAIADELAAEGIDVEVIDLRTIDPLGLDWDHITDSVRRTGAVAIVEDATPSHSIGARIAQGIH